MNNNQKAQNLRNTWKALARRLYRQREGCLTTIEQLQAGWDEALERAQAAEAEIERLRAEAPDYWHPPE